LRHFGDVPPNQGNGESNNKEKRQQRKTIPYKKQGAGRRAASGKRPKPEPKEGPPWGKFRPKHGRDEGFVTGRHTSGKRKKRATGKKRGAWGGSARRCMDAGKEQREKGWENPSSGKIQGNPLGGFYGRAVTAVDLGKKDGESQRGKRNSYPDARETLGKKTSKKKSNSWNQSPRKRPICDVEKGRTRQPIENESSTRRRRGGFANLRGTLRFPRGEIEEAKENEDQEVRGISAAKAGRRLCG